VNQLFHFEWTLPEVHDGRTGLLAKSTTSNSMQLVCNLKNAFAMDGGVASRGSLHWSTTQTKRITHSLRSHVSDLKDAIELTVRLASDGSEHVSNRQRSVAKHAFLP
jgi:hypothetical protein